MLDPFEGVNADGTIRTGARRDRVPSAFEPLLAEVVAEFRHVAPPGAELHLYGSVATGTARVGGSDVDLVAIDAPAGWAAEAGARLSAHYRDLCRGVGIGTATAAGYCGEDDESYGNRVFLRHYCVWLAGADALRSPTPFPAGVRAARGFNGDIGRHLQRWRAGDGTAHGVARKTLVAAAGIVSVRTGGWTTDRATAAGAWTAVDASEAAAMLELLDWSDGTRTGVGADDLAAAVGDGGIVASVAHRFEAEVGAWR